MDIMLPCVAKCKEFYNVTFLCKDMFKYCLFISVTLLIYDLIPYSVHYKMV